MSKDYIKSSIVPVLGVIVSLTVGYRVMNGKLDASEGACAILIVSIAVLTYELNRRYLK